MTKEFTEVALCGQCEGEGASEKFVGDEGFTICDDCNAIEGGYIYKYECSDCGDLKDEEKCSCNK